MKTLFIGCGNMGGTIIEGMLQTKQFSVDEVSVVLPPNSPNIQNVEKKFGIRVYQRFPETNFDAVLFAVKPQTLSEIVSQYQEFLKQSQNTLVISIVAGKTLGYFKKYFSKQPVVRIMPNLNALARYGSSVGCASQELTFEQIIGIEKMFKIIGSFTWVEEELIDAVTAVSGSGPAYFYLFTECLMKAANELGIEKNLAAKLATETFIGSAMVAKGSPLDISKLREAVTSLGGTTESALAVFNAEEKLFKLVKAAAAAATKRAKELAN
jgi:pyrroline-5-carboxylate reductase